MIRSLYMVELTVADWGASLRWYRDLLGLTLLPPTEAGRFALLGTGASRVALKAGVATPGSVTLTFEVESLSAMLGRLGNAEVKENEEGYRRVRLRDPDGYEVVLFEWVK
jgi:catechol 2,3-dioxygenase-like lactoylglutathione lyase family enzyme